MAEEKSMRLSQVAKILNKGLSSVAKSLSAKGFKVEINPNTKINAEQLEVLAKEHKSTELLNGTRQGEQLILSAEIQRHQEVDLHHDARPQKIEYKEDFISSKLPKLPLSNSKINTQIAQPNAPKGEMPTEIDIIDNATTQLAESPKLVALLNVEVVTNPVTHRAEKGEKLKYGVEEPSRKVSIISTANQKVESVNKNDPLKRAIELLSFNEYSQLPVMSSNKHTDGWITWKSISETLLNNRPHGTVQDCIDEEKKVVVLEDNTPLFETVEIVIKEEVVLIRKRDKTICGIITTADIAEKLGSLAEPFLILSEIENHLRKLLDGHYSLDELRQFKNQNDNKRIIGAIADLTFGEYVEIFKNPQEWDKLKMTKDRKTFVEKIDEVKKIRNQVMHFSPEGISATDITILRKTSKYLDKYFKQKK